MKRVVITGIGAITPISSGRDRLWRGVLERRSAVGRVTRFDPSPFRSQVAAQVDDFDPLDHLEAQRARRLDRFSQVAIGEAFKLIQRGGARVMLAGGVEAPLAPLTFGSFDLIRAISSNSNDNPSLASRPFDARRDGFVMSEGSAVLVLEELGHAIAR